MHATLLNKEAAAGGAWCDDGVSWPTCADTLRIAKAAGPPGNGASGDAAALRGPPANVTCFGPLNEWFLREPVLERCCASKV